MPCSVHSQSSYYISLSICFFSPFIRCLNVNISFFLEFQNSDICDPLPYGKLGYQNLDDFLDDIPDVVSSHTISSAFHVRLSFSGATL